MGLLNSALQVGRSAILSYEGALNVVGINISSAGSPDHTRLSVQLSSVHGGLVSGGLQPGAGVALTAIQRNIDEALEARVRLAIGAEASVAIQRAALAQTEVLFDDLNGTGISARLGEFFNIFDELQNTPEDRAVRDLVIANGMHLAESVTELRRQLVSLGEGIDRQISRIVESADAIAQKIARLNEEITTAESSGRGQAAALRDQRDALLRELSEFFDVTVREQSDGTINVYIGSESLVQGNSVRRLVAVTEVEDGFVRTSVRFADTNQQIEVRGGELEGLMISRDQHTQIDSLDRLAAALIADVNRIHADGQGLRGFTSVTGSVDLLAKDVALDASEAGLITRPRDGSFFITVVDEATGTPVAYRIDVTLDGTSAGTTLESLVGDINAQLEGVTASVTIDNRLGFDADDGFRFVFGYDGQDPREDTSGVLAALGINTFFTGGDARDMAVNEALIEDSSLLAASSVFLPGDGSSAGRIAALETSVSETFGDISIADFYRSIANMVAVRSGAVHDEVMTTSSVLSALRAQRESVSGVNLDEEAISLLKFERAFQGAARFIRVVDDLLTELVLLIR